ncbi:uncharacterized protein HaLaN_28811, partial [Haematococcus lacustris]
RSLNMMDEPYLMEVVKEAVCFVSKDVRNDLKLASLRSSPFKREFVLPDGVSNFRGYLKVLFHPSDVGLKQAGVAEAVVQAVSAVHPSLAPLLYNNDPALCAWEGMSNFVTTGQYQGVAMTKAQYEETGGNVGRSSQRW